MLDDSRPLPDDAVVVVRGGLHSLDHAKVVEDATDTRLRRLRSCFTLRRNPARPQQEGR